MKRTSRWLSCCLALCVPMVAGAQKEVDARLTSQSNPPSQAEQTAPSSSPAQTNSALGETWTDPDTKLMWTKKDNGSEVDWVQANSYCGKLQLAGHSDWRLPTFEELMGLYEPNVAPRGRMGITDGENLHVKGNLKLTGWEWSSTPGRAKDMRRIFNFANPFEERQQNGFPDKYGFKYNMRALCVSSANQSGVSTYNISLEAPKTPFQVNAEIKIQLAIENISEQIVPMGLPLGTYLGNTCAVELKDSRGDIVARRWQPERRESSEINEPEARSYVVVHLGPGQIIRRTIDVGGLFLISAAGNYVLRATCFDPRKMATSTTPPITISVLAALA